MKYWFSCLPWAMGWKTTVNVTLARTLFWFFGHALVYFWLLPAYTMYYTMLPKLAGGKLFSDLAGRVSLFLFLLFSVPVGVHHQFSDPSIPRGIKMFQGLLTFGVAIPSFITAFTLAASLEYAGKNADPGDYSVFLENCLIWIASRYLFAYLIGGLILFIFGGLPALSMRPAF